MHYVIFFHETDIKKRLIMKRILGSRLKMKMPDGYCNCRDFSLPLVRGDTIVEIDVMEPCVEEFEKVLDDIGFGSFRPANPLVKMVSKYMIRKLFSMMSNMSDGGTISFRETAQSRNNSRSFVMFRKSDDRMDDIGKCEVCGKKMPVEWT